MQHSFKFLRKLSTIQPLITAVMLIVFALAITPKRFLHNLVVNHKDNYSKLTNGKTEFSKVRITCQCDNLVATSPFTDISEKPEIKLPFIFVSYQEEMSSSNLFPAHIYFTLRGPPASPPI